MRVLVACEFSGTVRDAFTRAGHDAMSCDILPSETPGRHYRGDVKNILDGWMPVSFAGDCLGGDCDELGDECSICGLDYADTCQCPGPTHDRYEYKEDGGELFARPEDSPQWDLMVAHPPCTYLSVSGMHWTTRGLRDPKLTEDALEFVRLLMAAPIVRIAIENPVSVISSRIKKPSQIIQPHEYGHDASKATCLWLKSLPTLTPTNHIPPRMIDGKKRWANQCDSGQNKLGPSPDRWKKRAEFYCGVADAMADQWGQSHIMQAQLL